MKLTHPAATVALVAALFLGLFGASASATNLPIPGVDIVVKKNPGGNAFTITTGKDGTFNCTGLDEGKYLLTAKAPGEAKGKLSFSGLKVGMGAVIVSSYTTGTTATVEVAIAQKGGKITGVVTAKADDLVFAVKPAPGKKPAADAPAAGK